MNPNTQAREQARNLYFQSDLTQAQIASIAGINPKTLYTWIKKENWDRMKAAAVRTPAAITEKLYIQLNNLTYAIIGRESGSNFPTKDEAYVIKTLAYSIGKIKKQVSVSETIDVMMGFIDYINKRDNDLAKKVARHAEQFVGDPKEPYRPFEPEYDFKGELLTPPIDGLPGMETEEPAGRQQNQSHPHEEKPRSTPAGEPVLNENTAGRSNVIPLPNTNPLQATPVNTSSPKGAELPPNAPPQSPPIDLTPPRKPWLNDNVRW